jgi:hypothetical protein
MRLNRIAEVIGNGQLEALIALVEGEKRKQLGDESWRVYTGGPLMKRRSGCTTRWSGRNGKQVSTDELT